MNDYEIAPWYRDERNRPYRVKGERLHNVTPKIALTTLMERRSEMAGEKNLLHLALNRLRNGGWDFVTMVTP